MSEVNIKGTFGSLLAGGFACSMLSGVVWMQALLYFRRYHTDVSKIRLLVSVVWFIDSLHTGMVFASNWIYLIENYGDSAVAGTVPWTVGLTIILTAFNTFLVHCFFAHRVLTLSKYNWWVTTPIVVLAFIRLGSALATTIEMIMWGQYKTFTAHVGYLFTLGLAVSSLLDILITTCLLYYLRKARTGFSSMDQIIDSLSLYAVENGLATCLVTIVSLVCWLTMQGKNLIFLGLHFVISKLYANSFLATLNARKGIRDLSGGTGETQRLAVRFSPARMGTGSDQAHDTKLHINVERTIQFDIEQPGVKSSVPIDQRDSDEFTASDKHTGRPSSTISRPDIDEVTRSKS
jgi:hypothetical protein